MGSSYYLQVLFSFTILGLMLYGFYKVLGFYKSKSMPSKINVLDKRFIDNATYMFVVEYEDTKYVLLNNQKNMLLVDRLSNDNKLEK